MSTVQKDTGSFPEIVSQEDALRLTGWVKNHLNRRLREAGVRKMGRNFYLDDFKRYWDFINDFKICALYKKLTIKERQAFIDLNWRKGEGALSKLKLERPSFF